MKRSILNCFCLLLTMVIGARAFSAESDGTLTLREAVRRALSENPSLKESNEKINQADAQVPVARAAMLPNVSWINSANMKKDAASSSGAAFGGEPYNDFKSDFRATQSLFVFGSLSAIDVVKKDRDLRRVDAEIAARDLTSQVTKAYFESVLHMRSVDALKRQELIVKESLATAQRRERTGRGKLLDVLQVKTQLALLVAQVADVENKLQIATATLANLFGDNRVKQLKVRNFLDAPDLKTIDQEVKLSRYRLPELEKNSISLAQVEDQKRVARGQHLPSLNAVADYIYSGTKTSDVFKDTSNSWSLGLQLTIPIFSGLSSIYQQRALASQKTQLELSRMNIVNNTNLQQVTSRKQLETAEASTHSAKEALRLATIASDEARREYRLATIDFLQFLTVEKDYVLAESQFNTNKNNYIVALVNYYVSSGQDLSVLIDLLERTGR